MKDQSKTKQALIQELASLRQRISDLERSESKRKQVEDDALWESEDRYKRLVEGSPDIIWSFSDKSGTIYASARVQDILGYSPDYLYKNPWLWNESIHPDDRGLVSQAITDFTAGRDLNVEYRIKNAAGDWLWFHDRSIGRWVKGSEVIIEGISTHLTERKQAEETLRRSEENFRHSLDDSPMGVRIVTIEGETIYANRAILDIYGYDSIEELRTTPLKKRYTPESHADFLIRREKRQQGVDVPSEYTINIIRKDGEVRCLRVLRREILWDGERQFQVLYSDITDRKWAENALKRSEEKYQNIFDNIMEGVYRTTSEGRFIIINQAFAAICGYASPEEMMEKVTDIPKQLYANPEDRLRFQKKIAAEGFMKGFEVQFKHPIKKLVWVSIHSKAISDEQGNIRYYDGTIEDITNRKQMEANLRESEGIMRYIIEHDPNAIAVYDRNLQYIAVSNRYLQDYNVKESDIIGKHHYEVFPEMPQRWKDVHARCLAGAIERNDDDYFERPDGSITYNRWECRPWHRSDGEIGGIITYTEVTTERKKTEEALRVSEERFRRLSEAAFEAIAIHEEGVLLNANDQYFKMFGYEPGEVLGKQVTPMTVAPEAREFMKKQIATGGLGPYESMGLRKDGTRFPMEIHVRQMDYKGRNVRFGAIRDITERKEAEEALRESEEKYRTIVENMQEGYYEVDIKGNFTFFNESMRKIMGYENEELLGMNNRRYADEENARKAYQTYNRIYKTGEPVKNFEWQIIRKDGSRRDIEVSISLIRDAEGHPTGFRGIMKDNTERKWAELALRKIENRYRELFENMGSGVSVYETRNNGEDFIFEEYNAAAERLDKTPRGRVIGRSVVDVFPGVKDFGLFDVFQRVYRTGKPERHPVTFYKDEKISGWRENYVYKLPSGEIVAVFEDITEHKQAEEELRTSHLQLRALAERQQKAREEERIMIAREIHDEMGGGLTGLKMDLSWLLHKMGDADPGEERVALTDKIHTSNALIDQMIRVVRRISTDLRPSVLDDLGLIAALEWQLSEFTSRAEIQHEFTTAFEYVNMEEDTVIAVFRIFQEALTNVVRHSGATKVAVVLRESERSLFGDESLVLEIRDNGRGITEEEILNPESLGLLGMKERVLTFRGELSIRGEPGGGTALVLKIPRIQGEPS